MLKIFQSAVLLITSRPPACMNPTEAPKIIQPSIEIEAPSTGPKTTNPDYSVSTLKTFNDRQLITLDAACQQWWNRFCDRDRPCWLTIVGRTDNGKTHSAKALWKAACAMRRAYSHESLFTERILWWPDLVAGFLARKSETFDLSVDIRRWPLLVLDEVTAEMPDRLYHVVGQRENKWTILTSNLTLEAFGKIDERLKSRFFRNDGIVVEVDTLQYSARFQK